MFSALSYKNSRYSHSPQPLWQPENLWSNQRWAALRIQNIFLFTLFDFNGTPGKVTHINAASFHILAYNITENLFEMRHNILSMRGHIFVIHHDGWNELNWGALIYFLTGSYLERHSRWGTRKSHWPLRALQNGILVHTLKIKPSTITSCCRKHREPTEKWKPTKLTRLPFVFEDIRMKVKPIKIQRL